MLIIRNLTLMMINKNWALLCANYLDRCDFKNDMDIYSLPLQCFDYEHSDFIGFSDSANKHNKINLLSYIERVASMWESKSLPDFEHAHFPSRIQDGILGRKKSATRALVLESLRAKIRGLSEYQEIISVAQACMDAAFKRLAAEDAVDEARQMVEQYMR